MPTWRPAKPRCATPSVSFRLHGAVHRPYGGGRRGGAVAASQGDLGLVPVTAGGGAWWSALEADDARRSSRGLPFVERADHRRRSSGLRDRADRHPDVVRNDVAMWKHEGVGWGGKAARAASALADLIAIPEGAFDGAALLVSVPETKTVDDIVAALRAPASRCAAKPFVGSHATRYMVSADGARPVPTGR